MASSVRAHWDGPKESSRSDGDLVVETRHLVALLDPAGFPGERSDEIVFDDRGKVLHRHKLTWAVAAAVSASPKSLVIKPGSGSYRVVMQSHDSTVFRVTRIDCGLGGVTGSVRDVTPARSHTVQIEADGVRSSRQGRALVTVMTDHPVQPRVDIPLIVLEY